MTRTVRVWEARRSRRALNATDLLEDLAGAHRLGRGITCFDVWRHASVGGRVARQAVEEFRAASLPPADQSLWSQQRVVAYAEAQKAGDAPEALLRIPQLRWKCRCTRTPAT